MVFGTPGGDGQEQWTLQFFLNHVVFGMNLQEALDAPTITCVHFPSSFYPRPAYPNRVEVEGRLDRRRPSGLGAPRSRGQADRGLGQRQSDGNPLRRDARRHRGLASRRAAPSAMRSAGKGSAPSSNPRPTRWLRVGRGVIRSRSDRSPHLLHRGARRHGRRLRRGRGDGTAGGRGAGAVRVPFGRDRDAGPREHGDRPARHRAPRPRRAGRHRSPGPLGGRRRS